MKSINKKVARIQQMAVDVSTMGYITPEAKVKEKEFWAAVDALGKAADGLVGKHIQFSVADGYAHYIIVKANKQTVKVAHLSIMDAYHFQGVNENGLLFRSVAERQLRWEVGMKEIFSQR
jgi:hypothetical protein